MNLIKQLQQGHREFSLPAELALADGETLLCAEVLRVLPRKRAVMKGRWKGRAVLVKLMLDSASGRRNVRREVAGYRILREGGICTPELLLDVGCSGGRVLVFEFLQRAQTLGELWRRQAERRSDIAGSCLDLMLELGRKGCRHTDPHLDNFLWADDRVYVVDVASVRRGRSFVYAAWQRKNLARFLTMFTLVWRKKLMASLAAHHAEIARDPRLEGAVERAWRRRKSRYLKKCFRDSSEFSTRRNWRQISVWKRGEQSDDLVSFLQNPDDWITKGERIKDGRSATVVRVSMNGRQVVIRRNNIKHIFHGLQRCLRPTRSHTNWRNAHLLRLCGIATPDPIAFVENRWGFFRGRGYYVCAFDDSPSAEKKYQSQLPSERDLMRFSDLFASLRLARLYHGDLKASNLLVTDENIALIDLDSMVEYGPGRAERYLRKDRQRFLENWKNRPELRELFADALGDANRTRF